MSLKVKAVERLQKIGKYEGTYCYVMAARTAYSSPCSTDGGILLKFRL